MNHIEGQVGQKVLFGRTHGEKTLGVIVKINPKKFKVKQLENRGSFRDHPIGTVWTVPASLCSVVDGNGPLVAVQPPVRRSRRPKAHLPVMDMTKVFEGLTWAQVRAMAQCEREVSNSENR